MAEQRIRRLFELASLEYQKHPELSDRYVGLARLLGMRHRVRMPQVLKRRICKHCHRYLTPGKSSRVRLRGSYVAVTCLSCGKQMRYPY